MFVFLFTADCGFPNGNAAATRLLFYGRSLVESGNKVKIFCLSPSEYPGEKIQNINSKGSIEGIEYEYASGTTIRGKNRIIQNILVVKGLLHTIFEVYKLSKTEKIDAIFLYASKWIAIVVSWFLAKICHTRLAYERNEQPFYQADKNFFWKLISHVYTFTLYKLFDGAIVITDYLYWYMKKRMRSNTHLIKIPILVDSQEFRLCSSNGYINKNYLAYCGSLDEGKDGVEIIISSFSLIHNEFPDLQLVLIGNNPSKYRMEILKNKIKQLSIEDKVVFTGFISRGELLNYLRNARILLLAKHNCKQSEAAFPSKIAEYLASGSPVLITDVGEIKNYLTDQENVFLTKPDDINEYANKIKYILSNPTRAKAVGEKGRNSAEALFDYRVHKLKISNFLNNEIWE